MVLVKLPGGRYGIRKRMEVYVSDDQRLLWRRAAQVSDRSLGNWVRHELDKAAARELRDHGIDVPAKLVAAVKFADSETKL